MDYKRLEIYTWFTCNHKCIFCIEYANMKREWNNKVSKEEIMKKLLKYRKQWYNHVTFLWWEPFIHKIFNFALLFAKKLWYVVMVTTNASTLQFEGQSEKYLPKIDELIISIPIINEKKQLEINRTKWKIDFDKVFQNIETYWTWKFLKINTVINKLNLKEISNVIRYIWLKWVKELSITYPDINMKDYSKEFILKMISPSYKEVSQYIEEWFNVAKEYDINLILTDLPFCSLPDLKYHKKTDDFIYQTRTKISVEGEELDREEVWPRRRKIVYKCSKCLHKKTCWGPSFHYEELFWLDEIKPII